jgi:hypothetical protein
VSVFGAISVCLTDDWSTGEGEWEMVAYRRDGPWQGRWRTRSVVAIGGRERLGASRGGLPAGSGTSRVGMRQGGRVGECGSVTGR